MQSNTSALVTNLYRYVLRPVRLVLSGEKNFSVAILSKTLPEWLTERPTSLPVTLSDLNCCSLRTAILPTIFDV